MILRVTVNRSLTGLAALVIIVLVAGCTREVHYVLYVGREHAGSLQL